ncbi:hypothetical protein FisN_4Hh018 [Fistulifera solaris]|uniref:Coatomer subunit delta n=1 Tax=Fistulifera solaris TaxID=1519565 RepID=A0A1Z5KPZ5_FISSO|nr:hypothetical protein FisN_4Hh018 [Fistulifera solaris]|eukprot:GAX28356.1 hypothetical protein FisN_4Hh018 [Fistulifera solaris]
MVVLSASVCSQQGKALVSRQFVEMSRLRVEGLFAAFPKLVGHAKQHTFVETDSVRYVYQPLENNLYLLLVTTKTSNIVEDLGTLRLLAKVVPDIAGGFQEHAIQDHAFDLIFAFDEVLTAGGYKEEATLNSIRTNLVMDSHEERIADSMREAQEAEARKRMMDQAKKIQEQKMHQTKQNFLHGGTGGGFQSGGMEGFGGGGYGSSDPFSQQPQQPVMHQHNDPYAHLYQQQPAVAEAPKVIAKSGLKLGGGAKVGGGKSNNLMAAMAKEDNLFGGAGGGLGGLSAAASSFDISAPAPKQVAAPSTPLSVSIEEKVTVTMNREGAVDSGEVKGTLTVTANTDAGTMALVTVNRAQLPAEFNFATHPKIDKKVYETQNGALSLKGGKGFPVNRPVGILRWSYQGDDVAPLTINCWPEDEGTGSIVVNIEMELTRPDLVLHDVNILLPLGTTDPPRIENIDGQYKHDARAGMMCWHFDQIDSSNGTGSLEFSIPGHDVEAFFPVQVGFRSETLMCPLQVMSITNMSNGTPIPHQLTKSLSPDTYQCA